MSHDGSSAKSYIRHATEKERLDNLAFASFPEDYLPYAVTGQQRGTMPPPYLLWDDNSKRSKRKSNTKCAGALLCAMALVVVAILAVVATSVYLGVITDLFRSPVLSVSGRFVTSEEFVDELLNSTSAEFLKKAETYQSQMVRAFLTSPLEPALIAVRIYSFKPGLMVFFRVYLDRRKLDAHHGESPPSELVRELMIQELAMDPGSVHIDENEPMFPDHDSANKVSTKGTTAKPSNKEQGNALPPSAGGIGEWRPVPIEDSIKPSFLDRQQGGVGNIRSPEEFQRTFASVALIKGSLQPQNGVQVIEESQQENTLLSPTRKEGTGYVRLLEDSIEKVGDISVLETSKMFENPPAEKILISDEQPKKKTLGTSVSRAEAGIVRLLEDVHSRNPQIYSDNATRRLKTPPTLAPSVSLLVRNKSQSDKFRNDFDAKLERVQNKQNVGVASIREIITKVDSFSLLPPKGVAGIASRLLNFNSENSSEYKAETSSEESINLDVASISEWYENNTAATTIARNVVELPHFDNSEDSMLHILKNSKKETEIAFSMDNKANVSEDHIQQQKDPKSISVERILFGYTQNYIGIFSTHNDDATLIPDTKETTLYDYNPITDIKVHNFSLNTTAFNKPNMYLETELSEVDGDIHSSVVTHSHYPNAELHYHTVEKEQNASSNERIEAYMLEGHGFYQPSNSTPLSFDVHESVVHAQKPQSTSLIRSLVKYITVPSVEIVSEVEKDDISQPPAKIKAQPSEMSPPPENGNAEQDRSEINTISELVTLLTTAGLEVTIDSTTDVWPGVDEESNDTTEDNSQQPKIVPQLQSDLLSNGIEGEFPDPSADRFQDYILRHITTLQPQQNGTSSFVAHLCPPGTVACNERCGVRCDMRKDCLDNEDERGCSCSELLRAMGQSQKVCDGVDDCRDGSDESGCPWCQSPEYFRCPGSRNCIPPERICDGYEDCPGALDEKRCVALADSSAEAHLPEYRPEGYLMIRRQGRWGKLCLDSLPRSDDQGKRARELGRAVCSALTYSNLSSAIRTHDLTVPETSYYQISSRIKNNGSATFSLFEPSSCERKEVLRVHCHSLECGLRTSAASSQRRRIVGGKSANTGAWPWTAALYREGDFQCGAALVNNLWLISAAHCFYNSQGAYWVARLGVLRRGSELPSGGEQIREIHEIILHPQYEDVGFINDIALLRMDKPVTFSDFLRPICLPSAEEVASKWHGQRCSVVGWGKLYEIGHTFPDSLQEVRLPVISSEECQRRSIFLPAYRITPNMFCAGYERGGRDACLGDSGGPMVCPHPAGGRWVLLGVTSNGDGCGRPNRPGVYTQVATYLDWIQEKMSQQNESRQRTSSESNCIKGIRCHLGRCVPKTRICDGKRDCASGEDEENC